MISTLPTDGEGALLGLKSGNFSPSLTNLQYVDSNHTNRIQFYVRTVCQTKIADFNTINMISIELHFHAISPLIAVYLLLDLFEYQ